MKLKNLFTLQTASTGSEAQ